MKISPIYIYLTLGFVAFFQTMQAQEVYNRLQATKTLKKAILKTQNKRAEQVQLVSQKWHLPLEDSLADGTLIYFKDLDRYNRPRYYETTNYGSQVTLGVHLVRSELTNNSNYYGQGLVVGEWDGGRVATYHDDFDERALALDSPENDFPSTHSTHVAGTLIGNGQSSKVLGIENTEGMAPKATLHAYNWENDELEMMHEAESGLLISNHSYGLKSGIADLGYNYPVWIGNPEDAEDYHYGMYSDLDSIRDAIVYNFPNYLPVFAVGNDAANNGSPEGRPHLVINPTSGELELSTLERNAPCSLYAGYDCIGWGSIAKNTLIVGAIYKADYHAASFRLAPFSGRGPTDDGRIKPDIVAAGINIISTGTIYEGSGGYASSSGTSMAAPSATGSLALIQEAAIRHLTGSLSAAGLKAVVTATAYDAGNIGPDYHFGFGVLDVPRAIYAIENIKNDLFLIQEDSLANQASQEIDITAHGGLLKVTLAWTDVPGKAATNLVNDRTSRLVNDLDIRVYDASNNEYLPWILDVKNPANPATKGDNKVDNIEQIVLENALPDGQYKIKIYHKGQLRYDHQAYSIVVEGRKGTPANDLFIQSFSAKKTLESYNLPGMYLQLDDAVAVSFGEVKVNYTVTNTNYETLFTNQLIVDYTPGMPAVFIPLTDNATSMQVGTKYKVSLTIEHPNDTNIKNNGIHKDYTYHVAHIVTPDDLYTQDFFSYDCMLYNDKLYPNDRFSFGFSGNANTSYSLMVSASRKQKGFSLSIAPEASIRTNPYYILGGQDYIAGFWSRAKTFSQKEVTFTVNVRNAFDNSLLASYELQESNLSPSNAIWRKLSGVFNLPTDQYIYLEYLNIQPEGGYLVDDFFISFKDSPAKIVDFNVGNPNDLKLGRGAIAFSVWNKFSPVLYDHTYDPITPIPENTQFEWEVQTAAGAVFENGTTKNDKNPKIRILNPEGYFNVQLKVDDRYSSQNNTLRSQHPYVDLSYGLFSEHFWNNGMAFVNTFVLPDGFYLNTFKNSLVGIHAGAVYAYPPQMGFFNEYGGVYENTFVFDDDGKHSESVDKDQILLYRLFDTGDYKLSVTTTDTSSQGAYFNQTNDLLRVNVLDQFQPITQLRANYLNSSTTDAFEGISLSWKNPPIYFKEFMSFEFGQSDYSHLIHTEQREGSPQTQWRNEEMPTVHGSYAMLSLAIDPTNAKPTSVDNWMITRRLEPWGAQYLSFNAIMHKDFPNEQYEVYLLPTKNITGVNPTAQDFIDHGTLIKTQVLAADDVTVSMRNAPAIARRQIVDLDSLGVRNQDLYIAFRHHTRETDRGQYLAIDKLQFENEPYALMGYENSLMLDFGKNSEGFNSAHPHVYPVEGYEIAQILADGSRELIAKIDKQIIDTYTVPYHKIRADAVKLAVKFSYDTTQKNAPEYTEQVKYDNPQPSELYVDLDFSQPLLSQEFLVYPVPVSDHTLHILLSNDYKGRIAYTIYDPAGRTLFHKVGNKSTDRKVEDLDVKQLKGNVVYILKVETSQKTYTQKFTLKP